MDQMPKFDTAGYSWMGQVVQPSAIILPLETLSGLQMEELCFLFYVRRVTLALWTQVYHSYPNTPWLVCDIGN
jgi:hypothetical protein